MDKKSENLIFLFLVIFSVYCSLITGMSWDEPYLYELGKNRLKYLFSFGKLEYQNPIYFANASHFPGFYDTLTAFLSQMIPRKYEVQIHHIINLIFSISTLIGISKISKILFNKKVSKIIFLIAFLNPIYFGHMSINPKDTIIAFSNVWTTYFIIRYLQTQHIEKKRKYFSTLIGATVGLGLGVRGNFIATLLPIFLIFFLDVFNFKIFYKKKLFLKNFFNDFVKIFFISYFIMVIFWPDVHQNVLVLPFKLIVASITDVTFGTPWGLLNGEFYQTTNTPKDYLFINLFYKLPEYVVFAYIIFVFSFFTNIRYFEKKFSHFKKKILYLILIILIPVIIAIIFSLKIHDGLRYFLFIVPYLNIIPGLAIYYLINNSKLIINKSFIILTSFLFLFFLFTFISLTPYHYVYINKLNGNFSEASKRFENDYWGVSIKELVNKVGNSKNFSSDKTYKIAFCGINYDIGQHYLKKIKNFSFVKTSKDENYDYIIMTNRHNGVDGDKKSDVKTCFAYYEGKDVLFIKRNGLILSTIRQKI